MELLPEDWTASRRSFIDESGSLFGSRFFPDLSGLRRLMASLALCTSVEAISSLRCCRMIPGFSLLSYKILRKLFIDSSTCDTGSNPQGTGVFVLSIDKVDGLMA